MGVNLGIFIRENIKHFFILGVLGIYLLSINSIYTNKILVYGKPTSQNPSLPEPTQNLVFNLDRLEPTVYGGEELYKLIGFAFDKTDPNPGK